MSTGGAEPLAPRRKWLAITLATLLVVPAFWALLAGLVAEATDVEGGPAPAAAAALGLAVLPFAFIVLAFVSSHPRAPGAVLRAMGLAIVVGAPAMALAGDAVTGMVAGIGAGGIVSLRFEDGHSWRYRIWAVALAVAYTFVLVRVAGSFALLSAPVLPLTGIGVADHLSERRALVSRG